MHKSAMVHAELFFRTYAAKATTARIVEIGSMNVNGTIRDVAPKSAEYVGLDFAPGTGVDIVLQDAYSLPVNNDYADFVVSSSCFEHSQFFWLTFLESLRILKPDGVLYINVPSNGSYHRYPTDNWRFYPDAGLALIAWARRNGYASVLLESFIGAQEGEIWNDFVGVFLKHHRFLDKYPDRMNTLAPHPTNIIVHGVTTITNTSEYPQDIRRNHFLLQRLAETLRDANKV